MLTVGADILDWSCAGETWDFGKGFDAGETFGGSVFDDMIPVFAAHNFKFKAVFDWFFKHATHAINDDDTVKTFVVADSVGAETEDKSGEFQSASKAIGVFNIARRFNFEDVAGWTA